MTLTKSCTSNHCLHVKMNLKLRGKNQKIVMNFMLDWKNLLLTLCLLVDERFLNRNNR